MSTTDDFHVYRVAARKETIRLEVDGKLLGEGAFSRSGEASLALMFGDLGCSRATTYWDWFAYEVFPLANPPSWPPREEWHPGAEVAALTAILDSGLPGGGSARLDPAALSPAAAPCVALLALDAGMRGLLPAAYRSIGQPQVAGQLKALAPLFTPAARKSASRTLAFWTTPVQDPICDPAPDHLCPPPKAPRTPAPVPVGASEMVAALASTDLWQLHPGRIYAGLEQIAAAFRSARGVTGVDRVIDRLFARIRKLRAGVPANCGL
jgi:hypothetical protein